MVTFMSWTYCIPCAHRFFVVELIRVTSIYKLLAASYTHHERFICASTFVPNTLALNSSMYQESAATSFLSSGSTVRGCWLDFYCFANNWRLNTTRVLHLGIHESVASAVVLITVRLSTVKFLTVWTKDPEPCAPFSWIGSAGGLGVAHTKILKALPLELP